MRAKYQVLIIPFKREEENVKFCIFKRDDMEVWQGVAGGGEEGEQPIISAQRELYEETGVQNVKLIALDSHSTIPSCHFKDSKYWGKDFYVVPEYAFSVELQMENIILSDEHKEFRWVTYEQAEKMLEWDSNKTALWEINERINRGNI